MILDKIYTKLKFKNLVLFLVRLEDRSSVSFIRFDITFKKGAPIVEHQSETHPNNPEELLEDISVDTPVYLHITGKGIVNRLFNKEEIENLSVEELYPNYNPELNYCLRSNISSNQASIDFFRKRQLEENIIDTYFKGINIVGFAFGTAPIISVLDYFDFNQSKVIVEDIKFQKNESGYHAVKTTEQIDKLIFNEEEHSVDYVMAIAASIYFQLKILPPELLNNTGVDVLVASWLNKRIMVGFLGTLLVVLTLNYLLFSNYSETFNDKSSKVAFGQQTLKKLEQLKTQIKYSEKFISDNDILEQSNYTNLVDDIGAIASKKVQLLRLQIHPLEKEIRDKKEVKFKNRAIAIQGETSSVSKYKEFLAQLINLNRIKQIKSQTYLYDNKAQIGKFNLLIEYELK